MMDPSYAPTADDYAQARADDAYKAIDKLRQEVLELRRIVYPGYDERMAKEAAERSARRTRTIADVLKAHYAAIDLTCLGVGPANGVEVCKRG